ncbi:Uncharacterised protein [Vibrio cholerae]|nr:Uncharacterised protein [Vibrio cholerae]CSB77740.1 Uncharacterised protein [Vibrio cholerae]CSB91590.1 Uncharacterised protein [Vibrio cholerae]
MVWIVAATSPHDHVVTHLMSNFWLDFRIWVGAGKHHRLVGHQLKGIRWQQVRARNAEEQIRSRNHIFQRTLVGVVGKQCFVFIEIITASVDHAFAIQHVDFLTHCPAFDQ